MKKYILPTTLTITTFLLASCGSKDTGAQTSTETATQESVQATTGGHAEVKKALKGQVNSTTSDLMLKVTNYIDLQPAQYDIPSSLEGRDLVQVTVKWPMVAKHDLYLTDSHLLDHPDKPVVVEKIHSKDEQVEYVECNYVLEADGGGGYIAKNSQFTKQRFQFAPNLDKKENLGKLVLVKGSDEHMAAVKIAAGVKQEREEEERIAKAEAEANEAAAIQAKVDQVMSVLRAPGTLSGEMYNNRDQVESKVTVRLISEELIAGSLRINVKVGDFGKKSSGSIYEGVFDSNGKITLTKIKRGNANSYYAGKRSGTLNIEWAGHIDKLKVTGTVDVYSGYHAELLRDY